MTRLPQLRIRFNLIISLTIATFLIHPCFPSLSAYMLANLFCVWTTLISA
jgi:hypothetical protein